MREAIQYTGLQAHHIVETRLGRGVDLTIAVTPAEHQAFTNAWRTALPYGSGHVDLSTILDHASRIYANYPAIWDAVNRALTGR